MAGKKQLPPVRVVEDGAKAPAQSYSAAASGGSRLDELRAMRRVLAAHIDNPDTLARDLAALMRQAREISKEVEDLEAIELEAGGSVDDDGSTEDAHFRLEAI